MNLMRFWKILKMKHKIYRAVDLIQYIWKSVFNIDYSKSKIKRYIEQGAVKINDKSISANDIFIVPDKE